MIPPVDAGLLVAMALLTGYHRWWETDLYVREVALRGALRPPTPSKIDFVRLAGSS